MIVLLAVDIDFPQFTTLPREGVWLPFIFFVSCSADETTETLSTSSNRLRRKNKYLVYNYLGKIDQSSSQY